MSGLPPPPDYDPNRQGQYPPWNGQPDDHAQYSYPPATYPPPPDQDRPYYPPPQYPPPANMAAIHPHAQGQDPYRLPPPPGPYRPDVYAQPMAGPYSAAAPRQRTAIACRYCRRRKIRCSGFESSQDGRCSNCIRFNQECMFTPVSSQAQAFVPAHAAYPHLRNTPGGPPRPGVTLYGAHGQPLPAQHQPGGEALPPPPGMHGHYAGAPPLAPHMPDPRQPGARRGSGSAFDYPDPPNLAPVTPTGVAPGYQTHTAAPPHYPPPHDRRTSPQMAYAYEGRHSSSPNGSPYRQLQAPQGGATPPPSSTPGSSRGGMGLRDMLNHDNPGRTNADNDMLNALNRGRH